MEGEAAGVLGAIISFLAFDTARLSDPDIIARLILQALLFAGSAFFSSSETALFSLSQADLQRLRREKNPQAGRIRRLLDEPRQLIVSILCGNELINIAASVNLAGILLALYGDPGKAALFNVLVMFPLLLVLGEITPKTIAVSDPIKISTKVVAAPMTSWVSLVAPLRYAVRIAAEKVTTLIVGEQRAKDNILGVDEFRSLLSNVEKEGVIKHSERRLIENLVEASQTKIEDVMVPRPRIKFVSADEPVETIFQQFRALRQTRVPVYRGHRDTIIGFLHAEDMVHHIQERTDLSAMTVEDLVHPPVIVPPTKKVDEMFDFFKEHQTAAAAVINEFGGVDGFITIKDILGFLFEDLTGHQPAEEYFEREESGVYVVSGLLKLDDFNALTRYNLDDDHMTTVGGYVFRHLDRLPTEGEKVVIEGLTFAVLEMDGHLIKRARISTATAQDEHEAEATAASHVIARKGAENEPEEIEETASDPSSADAENSEDKSGTLAAAPPRQNV